MESPYHCRYLLRQQRHINSIGALEDCYSWHGYSNHWPITYNLYTVSEKSQMLEGMRWSYKV